MESFELWIPAFAGMTKREEIDDNKKLKLILNS